MLEPQVLACEVLVVLCEWCPGGWGFELLVKLMEVELLADLIEVELPVELVAVKLSDRLAGV